MQGDKRIDKLMLPVLNAINRHVKDRDAKTDIYNRAYEAVMISMVVKTSTTGVKTPSSIENTNPDYYKQEIARRDEIITRLKEVLPTLKISHNYCEDCWYSCPKAEDGCCDERAGEDCNCGADEWNARIDLLVKELEC